jgi:hypothetical protein
LIQVAELRLRTQKNVGRALLWKWEIMKKRKKDKDMGVYAKWKIVNQLNPYAMNWAIFFTSYRGLEFKWKILGWEGDRLLPWGRKYQKKENQIKEKM